MSNEPIATSGQARAAGAGWFRAGAIGLLVFGAIHLLAVFDGLFREPTAPVEVEVKRALLAFSLQIGPFRPTAFHTTMLLNASYSIFLFFVGVLDLVALRPAIAAGRFRALAYVNIVFVALLLAACAAAQFPPPLVLCLVILILFCIALARYVGARRAL